MCIICENVFTIDVLFFIAACFPIAFPPIVAAAIVAVVIKLVNNKFKLNFVDNVAAISTPADPDMIPQMSPITSLQNDDTFAELFIRFIPVFAYLILFEFIEWNGLISHVVIATPTISNIIPISMNITNIIILVIKFTFGITISDVSENMNDIINAMIIIFNVQLSFFILFSFRNSFLNKKNGY